MIDLDALGSVASLLDGMPPPPSVLEFITTLKHDDMFYRAVAADMLANRAEHCPQTRRDIVHHQGIVPLVVLLREGSDSAVEHAARALANLAVDQGTEVAAAGAIPALIDVVKNGSDVAKAQATFALQFIWQSNVDFAIAIAMSLGFGALLELEQDSRVKFGSRTLVGLAGAATKRKAALILRRLQGTVPEEIAVAIAAYLP